MLKDTLRNAVCALEVEKDSQSRPAADVLNESNKRKRIPRRILHFSDGTIEEYSTDEDEDTPDSKADNQLAHIDPRQLTWFPWMWYQASSAASQTLQVCDYLGESLANFFGITTPKYQYEIEEYHRIVEEEKEAQRKMDMEMGGWVSSTGGEVSPVENQPETSQASCFAATVHYGKGLKTLYTGEGMPFIASEARLVKIEF